MQDNYLKNQWDSLPLEGDGADCRRTWKRISARLFFRPQLLRITAAAAAVIAAVLTLTWRTPQGAPDGRDRTVQEFVVSAPLGTRTRVALPDGTTVFVNAGSTLTYTSDFNKEGREVSLTGEAFFDVAKDPERPFHVRVGACTISVLGTRFNVLAYTEDQTVEAVLLEGSVRFETASGEILMQPGERVAFSHDTLLREEVDASQYCAWTAGAIRFDSISLQELCRRLSRTYDIEVLLPDTGIAARRVRVSFTKDDSIDTIIKTLSAILPIEVTRAGRTLYITER